MTYKVYTLEDPITNNIRYIGITKQTLAQRITKHLNDTKLNRNNHRANWLRKLLNNNKKPLIKELDIALSYNELLELETYWILQFKAWGYNLVNTTNGGEGSIGYKHSLETLEKMKKIRLEKPREKKDKVIRMTKTQQNAYLSNLYSIKIVQYDINGKLLKVWKSCKEAASYYKSQPSAIGHALKNPESSSLKFFWRYSKEINPNFIDVSLKKGNKYPVEVTNHTENTIIIYNSLEECQKTMNISYPTLKKYIKNKKLYIQKFTFKYS
jgi:hypothetical protein